MKALFATAILFALPSILFAQANSRKNSQAASKSGSDKLSKDYLKAAIKAMSSIDDLTDKGMAVLLSMKPSSDGITVNREATERASDAAHQAALDVKLAKADVGGFADKDFQTRLEIYLEVARVYTQAEIDLKPGSAPPGTAGTVGGCSGLLEQAVDKGSTKIFAEHPGVCTRVPTD